MLSTPQAAGQHQPSMLIGQDRCRRLGICPCSISHGNKTAGAAEADSGYACRIAAISWTPASPGQIFSPLAPRGVLTKALDISHVSLLSHNEHLTMSPDNSIRLHAVYPIGDLPHQISSFRVCGKNVTKLHGLAFHETFRQLATTRFFLDDIDCQHWLWGETKGKVRDSLQADRRSSWCI